MNNFSLVFFFVLLNDYNIGKVRVQSRIIIMILLYLFICNWVGQSGKVGEKALTWS